MIRQGNSFQSVGCTAAIAVVIVAGLTAQVGLAQGLRYQDANELADAGTVNVSPVEAFKSNLPVVDNDNLWNYRDFGAATTIYQSGISEDSPMLTQTLTGLTANKSYDLYAVYWTDEDENWTVRTGTTPGSLTFYSWTGAGGSFPVPGSTPGVAASMAVWDVVPPPTKEGTVFTERAADPLVMILGYAGTASANGAGQINVLIDDNANAGGPRRTWFDGVAYVDAGTPIAATAALDRATGSLTITNPTAKNFQIKSYRIESPTTGALNATSWTTINSTNPSWTVTMPTDPGNTPFTNILSEDGAGSMVTLAANGGSMSFGNVWNASPFDHVLLYLTLADDSVAVLAPKLTGPAIANGDLDGNGVIDLSDFQTLLTGLQTTAGLTTRVENYRLGDLTGDGLINFSDWAAFRTAFDAANGAGAFNATLAQVPEPGSLTLVLVAGVVASMFSRRRIITSALALMACLHWAGAANAVSLLKVDVDARAGDSTAGPPGPNTVDGFSPYTMEAGSTGGLATSTGSVNGYTITLTAVDAAGNPLGMFDDRDRATPTTAPTLNQLYDDFIFANVSTTGEGGGLDMVINSGGALMPNTQYNVSIYSFDTSSGGLRTANWLDGNNADSIAIMTAFDGANSPATDEQYKFNGVFGTDASGNLLLRARETAAASHGVFLNGFEISTDTPPPPVELTLQVNTMTGAVRIVNEQSVSFDMSYYEVRSPSGALKPSSWSSLDDAESGDPLGTGWDEVPASNGNLLSEVNLQSMTTLAPGSSVSLGSPFTIGGAQDLQLLYAGPNETLLHIANVAYVSGPSGIAGDYNGNGTVDAADYVVWRKNLGSSTTLPNDATAGVTQADYDVWRAHYGQSGGGAGAGLGSATVPEPATLALLAVVVGLAVFRPNRRFH